MLMILFHNRIQKGHFNPMELPLRQMDQQYISNIMIQDIDSAK